MLVMLIWMLQLKQSLILISWLGKIRSIKPVKLMLMILSALREMPSEKIKKPKKKLMDTIAKCLQKKE